MCQRTLEDELISLFGSDRSARIAARYFGLDGQGGASMQTVGEEVGLTRERVRQILTAIRARLHDDQIETPILDRVISLVTDNLPSLACEIEDSLHKSGLTATTLRMEKLVAAACFLNRTPSFVIINSGERLVIHGNKEKRLNSSISMARSLSRRLGATTVDLLIARLNKTYAGSDWEWIRHVLPSHPDVRWLDRSKEWFWFFDVSKNQVVRRIYKVLSVGSVLSLTDLGDAVRRELGMREFRPPDLIFRELCRQLPHVVLEGNFVRSSGFLPPPKMLSHCEHVILSVLRKHGGVLRRQDLFRLCARPGMSSHAINQCLAYSPIVIKRGRNTYGLVGEAPRSHEQAQALFPLLSIYDK
jgi:hypothetical protein